MAPEPTVRRRSLGATATLRSDGRFLASLPLDKLVSEVKRRQSEHTITSSAELQNNTNDSMSTPPTSSHTEARESDQARVPSATGWCGEMRGILSQANTDMSALSSDVITLIEKHRELYPWWMRKYSHIFKYHRILTSHLSIHDAGPGSGGDEQDYRYAGLESIVAIEKHVKAFQRLIAQIQDSVRHMQDVVQHLSSDVWGSCIQSARAVGVEDSLHEPALKKFIEKIYSMTWDCEEMMLVIADYAKYRDRVRQPDRME